MPQHMFAEKDQNGVFRHIHPSKVQLAMCGCRSPVKIEVTPCDEGDYWGWDDGKTISMIWKDFRALAMCFPYGIAADEKRGEGKRVRLAIVEITD